MNRAVSDGCKLRLEAKISEFLFISSLRLELTTVLTKPRACEENQYIKLGQKMNFFVTLLK